MRRYQYDLFVASFHTGEKNFVSLMEILFKSLGNLALSLYFLNFIAGFWEFPQKFSCQETYQKRKFTFPKVSLLEFQKFFVEILSLNGVFSIVKPGPTVFAQLFQPELSNYVVISFSPKYFKPPLKIFGHPISSLQYGSQ